MPETTACSKFRSPKDSPRAVDEIRVAMRRARKLVKVDSNIMIVVFVDISIERMFSCVSYPKVRVAACERAQEAEAMSCLRLVKSSIFLYVIENIPVHST